VGVQKVRWDGKGYQIADNYTFLYGKGNINYHLGTGFFYLIESLQQLKRVEFVNDRMSYITPKGCCFCEELEQILDQFPRNHMKHFLGDFNAKVGKEDTFKPIIGNEILHEVSNDNGVRVVNFSASKTRVVKRTTFPHCDVHKHTCTCPDGVTHNLIDHVLVDQR
jgi:hypothetical protein